MHMLTPRALPLAAVRARAHAMGCTELKTFAGSRRAFKSRSLSAWWPRGGGSASPECGPLLVLSCMACGASLARRSSAHRMASVRLPLPALGGGRYVVMVTQNIARRCAYAVA